ncbi:hypothetical protein LB530_29705, partial [Mesorhizobium sp. CO1-1-3]|uniref:hypothetical protein n=1 Tax=Mesorhizobium sp. CO1-1-3 TaxID=2876634 RepID=UPI001CCECBA0
MFSSPAIIFFGSRKNLAEPVFKPRSVAGQFSDKSAAHRENNADNGLSGRASARAAANTRWRV